jgi:hypothetical protein
LSENEKWAEKLSDQCGMSVAFLSSQLQELIESCHGDARTAKEVIEELVTSCGFTKDDLQRLIEKISKSCPFDIKKFKKDVLVAKGDKDEIFEAVGERPVLDRGGAR